MSTLFVQILAVAYHRHDERGATLVEYALLISLIALVCFAAVAFFGAATSVSLSRSASKLS
jgi:pilus assembly protein Flp/PilA